MDILLAALSSFFGSLCFAILFNIRGKNVFYAAFGGMIGWTLYTILGYGISDVLVRSFISSVAVSLYSNKMARLHKAPALVYLVIAFIPLVPGFSIYKAMELLIISDTSAFIDQAVYTFKIGMVIATGFLITSNINFITSPIHIKKSNKRGR